MPILQIGEPEFSQWPDDYPGLYVDIRNTPAEYNCSFCGSVRTRWSSADTWHFRCDDCGETDDIGFQARRTPKPSGILSVQRQRSPYAGQLVPIAKFISRTFKGQFSGYVIAPDEYQAVVNWWVD